MEEKKLAQNLGDFGERLYELRRKRGISQEELAGAIGVSRQAVSKWEGCQAQPELEKAVALAEYFEVSLDWLLRGVEPPKAAGEAKGIRALPQVMVIIGTALVYIGLLLAWAIWDYWQISLSVALGAGFMILGVALLLAAQQLAADNRGELVRRFWRYSIWPVAYLGVTAFFTGFSRWGRVAPVISVEMALDSPGNFAFAVGAWLIICGCVYGNCRK